jgi:hypothetical protein
MVINLDLQEHLKNVCLKYRSWLYLMCHIQSHAHVCSSLNTLCHPISTKIRKNMYIT